MKAKDSALRLVGVRRPKVRLSRGRAKTASPLFPGLVELRPRLVPFRAVQKLADKLQIKVSDLLSIVGISDRTAARRKKEGYLKVEEADRLLRVAGVVEDARRIFGAEDRAVRWLTAPHPLLANASPLSQLNSDAGTRLVIDEMTRIEYGDFA